ncbi:MAG: hypothetical protein JNK63_06600 [Chthonomonas sp.]|nr:hypothetical protein [Chthonomonas sp.]
MKAPNDKKQTIILGALGAVLLGVGAFQFIGGGGGAAADTKLKPASEADNAAVAAAATEDRSDNQYAGMPLAQRDPFAPQVPATDATASSPKPPAPKPNPYVPLQPMPVPNPGPMVGSLPNPGGYASENTGNFASNRPPVPSMKLSGVVIGGRQVALIQTESGKQRTVGVGDMIGGQKVVSISRRGVVLEGHGQRLTLTLDDNAEN